MAGLSANLTHDAALAQAGDSLDSSGDRIDLDAALNPELNTGATPSAGDLPPAVRGSNIAVYMVTPHMIEDWLYADNAAGMKKAQEIFERYKVTSPDDQKTLIGLLYFSLVSHLFLTTSLRQEAYDLMAGFLHAQDVQRQAYDQANKPEADARLDRVRADARAFLDEQVGGWGSLILSPAGLDQKIRHF